MNQFGYVYEGMLVAFVILPMYLLENCMCIPAWCRKFNWCRYLQIGMSDDLCSTALPIWLIMSMALFWNMFFLIDCIDTSKLVLESEYVAAYASRVVHGWIYCYPIWVWFSLSVICFWFQFGFLLHYVALLHWELFLKGIFQIVHEWIRDGEFWE